MDDKQARILANWESFLKGGLQWRQFTKALYHHLIQHCSFIAHYSRQGFYADFFTTPEGTRFFLRQFDSRNIEPGELVPKSVEYSMTYWGDGEYNELNQAMVRVADAYIPGILTTLDSIERERDLAEAKRLLAKHGIEEEI